MPVPPLACTCHFASHCIACLLPHLAMLNQCGHHSLTTTACRRWNTVFGDTLLLLLLVVVMMMVMNGEFGWWGFERVLRKCGCL